LDGAGIDGLIKSYACVLEICFHVTSEYDVSEQTAVTYSLEGREPMRRARLRVRSGAFLLLFHSCRAHETVESKSVPTSCIWEEVTIETTLLFTHHFLESLIKLSPPT
jgi:hypothetical protein